MLRQFALLRGGSPRFRLRSCLTLFLELPAWVREKRLARSAKICPYCEHELRGGPKNCPECGARISNDRASRGRGVDPLVGRLTQFINPKPRLTLGGLLRRRSSTDEK